MQELNQSIDILMRQSRIETAAHYSRVFILAILSIELFFSLLIIS